MTALREERIPRHRETAAEYCADAPRPLPEFHLYQARAGHPDWPRLAGEARELAAAILPKLEAPVAAGRRRAAAYRTAAQNFIENRRRARAGREDLLPLYFIWTMLRACNFRCTYCDDHQGRKYPDLPTKGALDTAAGRHLLEVMRTRTPSIYFAGGEPTARNDLPELTRAARDLRYFPILINTNGSLVARQLTRPEWRTWLADTDVVIVSLDGLDLARLGRLWVTDAPHTVVRNLLLLRELAAPMRFKLMVNCVLEPGQLNEAEAVLDVANDLGIWFAPVPMNAGPRIVGGLHGDPAYAALTRKILARKREGHRIVGSERLNTRLLESAPLECRNTLKPHVDFDGRLAWPCKASVNVAPARIDVLGFDDVDALFAHARTLIEPRQFHGPAANQCGAECNWAQNYTTDAYAHGLLNPWSLAGEVLELVRSR